MRRKWNRIPIFLAVFLVAIFLTLVVLEAWVLVKRSEGWVVIQVAAGMLFIAFIGLVWDTMQRMKEDDGDGMVS